jgi:phosphoribosyl 1,2-cyclic phosphodiesterase
MPATGAPFVRYGGNTSCLAIAPDDGPPRLVLDAGTGIRRVGALTGGAPFEGAVLLSHFHWDHVMGLPFFGAGDREEASVDLYGPAHDVEATLAEMMSPPHFPIGPRQLRGTWRFLSLEPGVIEIQGFSVLTMEVPHKGGRTYGYRVSDGTATVAYIPDHCPTALGPGPHGLGALHEAVLTLSEGADAVFHDAQYTDDELPPKAHFGHAAAGYAVALTKAARARRSVLFHHDLDRTDAAVDGIVASLQGCGVAVEAATEGTVLQLP